MSAQVFNRSQEIKLLDEIYNSSAAEFFALYGRRRVGKTYLISQYFHNKGYYFELTGRKSASKKAQLKNFATVYADSFERGAKIDTPKDWDDAFNLLRTKIEQLDPSQKITVFLDELPWLASRKSGFLDALDLFWNRYMSRTCNVILIVCGSAAAWMIKKIISNKAGLHNRLTRPPIHLKPFTLKQSEEYLAANGVILERKQLIDLYMAIGGIPYYLKFVPQGKSSAEIINFLFFSEHAPLISEFHRLYSSLFDHYQKHVAVIKALATSNQGLSQKELYDMLKDLSPGGGATDLLKELESSDFIMRVGEFGKKKKETRYRLIDSLSLFHLKWVEGVGEISPHYWLALHHSQSYRVWAGYAFENLCFQHYPQIVKALELTVTAKAKSSWRYIPGKSSEENGAQIDMLIDRTDRCINLCEFKFYEGEFVIDKTYADKLISKKNCFREKTKTRKNIFITILSNGILPALFYRFARIVI